jgi:hypothetical protein
MAVIEYMLYKDAHRRQVPDFVGDRGHWMSPIDNTFIGWIDDVRDYYVPDTIVTLTKEQFVQRQLRIHAQSPFRKSIDGDSGFGGAPGIGDMIDMTEQEVIAQAETWYDDFVTKNSA